MRLRTKIIWLLLVLVLLAPTAFVSYVVTTESGLQFVARRLGKVGPVTINITDVHGTLVRGVSFSSLRIQHKRVDIQVGPSTGRIELLPLLLRRIKVPQFTTGDIAIQVFPADGPHTPWTPHFLPATLRIDVGAVQINRVTITAGEHKVEFSGLRGIVTILPKQLRVRSGVIDFEALHAEGNVRLRAADPLGVSGDVNLLYRPEGQPQWRIAANISGDLNRMPIKAKILAPFKADTNGVALTLTSGWRYEGHARASDFDLATFGGTSALGLLAGELDITADAKEYTAHGNVIVPLFEAGPLASTFTGFYSNKQLEIRSASFTHAASGTTAKVHGQVELVEGGPRLELSGDWSRFRWPLATKEPAFNSARGTFRLSGLKPWKLEADGLVSANGFNDLPGSIRGTLATDSLLISSGRVGVLGGTATFTGDARWNPAQSWHIKGHAENFDPTSIRPDLPGRLSFDFDARGAPFGGAAALDLDLQRLGGTLRAQNASGSGHFSRAAGSEDWQFKGVDLRLGRTHVQLDGGLGARSDLRFALEAEDLSLLDPDARGRVTASGRFAGTSEAPILLVKARGTDFEWRDYQLAALNADVDIDLGTSRRTEGQVELAGLHFAGRTVQRAQLQLQGTMDAQHLLLEVDAPPLRSALAAEGVFADGLWRGQITSLAIDGERDLRLKLEGQAPLRFSAKEFHVDDLCIKGTTERLCTAALLDPNGLWRVQFNATDLPLSALTAGLTADVDYDGTIALGGEATGAPGVPITGNLRAQLQGAQLRHKLSNGREEKLSLGNGGVAARATADAFNVEVSLDAGDAGRVLGRLDGQRNTPDWHDHPIQGSLDADTAGLGLLDLYLGGIDRASGRITTKVGIGGTLGQPTLEGTLQLRDAQIDIFQVNLSMRDLSLDARFNANSLDLTGQSRVGEGTAKFNGRIAWRDREPYGNLHVEGENLRVVDVPEARIDASPNLDFKLTGRRIDASGEVRLPSARLEPADLTNAVLASGDEVLVGAPPEDPASRWIVVSDIRLTLGDNVHINSLGLTGTLGGSILLRTDESQVTRGQGELNVTTGKYMAMGRLLDIERGRLIFSNGPVGDPGIDLRAEKEFPDITAGVNVRGTLRAPRMTFYSEPAISQSQIASLLLAGGSLESVQGSSEPGAARNDLLAQGGAIIGQRFGSHVGIDEVSIESNLDSQTSLVLGRYLSPRLYIGYGISLSEAINTLKLRYTIGDRWTFRTEAGEEQSADIVFTIRKK